MMGSAIARTGYRIFTSLFMARNLYVDDLVTADAARSKGYGKLMLDWLREIQGRATECKAPGHALRICVPGPEIATRALVPHAHEPDRPLIIRCFEHTAEEIGLPRANLWATDRRLKTR